MDSESRALMRLRSFETIMNNERWIGQIATGSYVFRMGARVYTVTTVGAGTDDRGDYAIVEPFDEPLGDALWLSVQGEEDLMVSLDKMCCRIALRRVGTSYIDPRAILRERGIDPESVNVLAPSGVETIFSVLFDPQGTPVECVGSAKPADDQEPRTH